MGKKFDLKKFLKKRFSDIILVIAVLLVFFLTGNNNTSVKPPTPSSITSSDSTNPASTNSETLKDSESSTLTTTNSAPENNPSSQPLPVNQNSVAVDNIQQQNTNQPMPVNKMFPNPIQPIDQPQGNNALGESLKNLKSNQATTEDIVNRNAYFQKLTEQLNQLQGSTSTDSEGTNNNQNNQAQEPTEDDEESVQIDADEEPEVDVDAALNQATPPNPYKEMGQKFPAPNIAE